MRSMNVPIISRIKLGDLCTPLPTVTLYHAIADAVGRREVARQGCLCLMFLSPVYHADRLEVGQERSLASPFQMNNDVTRNRAQK